MAAEENPTAPLAGGTDPAAEDRMTILQRRLAEIQGKRLPRRAGEATPEAQVELPAQGTPALPAGQPAGAGTAEAPCRVANRPAHARAGSPEAAAAAETAQHVPDAVTERHRVSAPQARALAHYGDDSSAASSR